jgi:hypothetical protein
MSNELVTCDSGNGRSKPIASKMTTERLNAICETLRKGATRSAAARSNGINRDTLYEWMNTYPDVSDMITRAEAEFRTQVEVKFGEDALIGSDWRARESLLKRRYPETWGDKIDLRAIPTEKLLELLGGDACNEEPWPTLQRSKCFSPAEEPNA